MSKTRVVTYLSMTSQTYAGSADALGDAAHG